MDNEYTVFGKVLAGMEVAKIIEGQPKNNADLPDQRIKMYIRHVSLSPQELIDRGIVL